MAEAIPLAVVAAPPAGVVVYRDVDVDNEGVEVVDGAASCP